MQSTCLPNLAKSKVTQRCSSNSVCVYLALSNRWALSKAEHFQKKSLWRPFKMVLRVWLINHYNWIDRQGALPCLFGAGWGSSGGFCFGHFEDTQAFVEFAAGPLSHLLLNVLPDGNLQNLQDTFTCSCSHVRETTEKTLSGWSSRFLTFCSFCSWTTLAFLGAMVLPFEHKNVGWIRSNRSGTTTTHSTLCLRVWHCRPTTTTFIHFIISLKYFFNFMKTTNLLF